MKLYHTPIILMLLSLICLQCATNPVTGKRDLMLISEDQEKEMGRASDTDIVAYFGLYQDQQLQQFINVKGKEMAKISHRPSLDFEFKIVDSPVINAFAVPGGYIYFTRGIMAHFNNEAEFAGVLGHEIGHVTARHSAKQYTRSMIAQTGLSLGSILSPEFGQLAGLAQNGTGLLFLKFGRDAERQSDKLGVEYSTAIGYDAHQMADFFQTLERMSANSGQSVPNFLSTHPQPGERYNTVHNLATKAQARKTATLLVNRDNYLDMIDGIVYGEDPRQGFVEVNTFYHPELKFQFPVPTGWQLVNTPQQVQMTPKSGEAVMIFTLSAGSSVTQAASDLLTNYNLEQISIRNTTVNGLEAALLEVKQVQESGETIVGLAYLIKYGNNIYNMIGISSTAKYSGYKSQFVNTGDGFQPLTDQNKINRQPKRIKIQTVSTDAPLESQFKKYGVGSGDFEELAILNGMLLQDIVKKNTRIKLIK